jgi:hypothetical protein
VVVTGGGYVERGSTSTTMSNREKSMSHSNGAALITGASLGIGAVYADRLGKPLDQGAAGGPQRQGESRDGGNQAAG